MKRDYTTVKTAQNPLYLHRLIVFCVLTSAAICVAMPATAGAATYYLDAVNGSDSNPGTSDEPWQTLSRAMPDYSGAGTRVTDGDTVQLRSGNYGNFTYGTNDPIRTDWIV